MTLNDINRFLVKVKKPFCILLIGPPLSGKDTLISNLEITDVEVISRDDIVLELCPSMNYNEAFKSVNQKLVDKVLKSKIRDSSSKGSNVIINLTNLRRKKRTLFLSNFSTDYTKIGIIFPILYLEEYAKRNEERNSQQGKFIPLSVIQEMVDGYESIDYSEDFDKIINYKY